MKAITSIFAVLVLSGCANTVPQEMKLIDPQNRKLVDNPGRSVDAMRQACAESMLNASPATEATEITATALSPTNPAIIEVNAVLKNVGFFQSDLPVTYRCEYSDGRLMKTNWTRGLK